MPLTTKPIPERYLTRYKLAKAQLELLPLPQDDPKDRFLGTRSYCNEVIEFSEELGAAEARADDWIKRCTIAEAALSEMTENRDQLREAFAHANNSACKSQQQVTQQASTLAEVQKERDDLREQYRLVFEQGKKRAEAVTQQAATISRSEALTDLAYCNGAKAGWNAALGPEEKVEEHRRAIRERSAQAMAALASIPKGKS